jgi:hypothetical protein
MNSSLKQLLRMACKTFGVPGSSLFLLTVTPLCGTCHDLPVSDEASVFAASRILTAYRNQSYDLNTSSTLCRHHRLLIVVTETANLSSDRNTDKNSA